MSGRIVSPCESVISGRTILGSPALDENGRDAWGGHVEQVLQADHKALQGADFADGQQNAWHEGAAVGGVVAQGQDLAGAAEEDFMVCDEAGQPNAVNGDIARV